jgi:hypothetical protein
MNSKKARSIRQLVEHLQHRGNVQNPVWAAYNYKRNDHETLPTIYKTEAMNILKNGESIAETQNKWMTIASKQERYVVKTLTLDPTCGRAIYQQMKKRHRLSQSVYSAK